MTLATKGRCPLCHETVDVAYDVKFCVIDGEQQYRYTLIGRYQHQGCIAALARERYQEHRGSRILQDAVNPTHTPGRPKMQQFQHVN